MSINVSKIFSTLLFVEAPEAKWVSLEITCSDIARHPLSVRKFFFANVSARSCRLPRIPRYISIFFASYVRPILAAFALFSRDSHAAVSRDPKFRRAFVRGRVCRWLQSRDTLDAFGSIFFAFFNRYSAMNSFAFNDRSFFAFYQCTRDALRCISNNEWISISYALRDDMIGSLLNRNNIIIII